MFARRDSFSSFNIRKVEDLYPVTVANIVPQMAPIQQKSGFYCRKNGFFRRQTNTRIFKSYPNKYKKDLQVAGAHIY